MADLEAMILDLEGRVNSLEAELASVSEGLLDDQLEFFRDVIPESKKSFGFKIRSDNQLTIFPGTLQQGEYGNFDVAETTLTLTSTTEWIYITRQKSGGSATVTNIGGDTQPDSTGDAWSWTLYKFTAVAGKWRLTQDKRDEIKVGAALA